MTSIQPELWVDQAASAVEFYRSAFGARVVMSMGDGQDIVAHLVVDGAGFWVASASAAAQRFSPRSINGATGRTLLAVDDPDAVFERSVAAGATAASPVAGARVAGGSDHRPVRPRMGDRAASGGLATELTS